MSRIKFNTEKYPKKSMEKGALLPLLAIGMLAVIGVAGFAIDSSHAFVNVTRLQNALDAAALSSAKSLNAANGSMPQAIAHGTETFDQHLEGELGAGNLQINFEFSSTLVPFGGAGTPRYVRASVVNFTSPLWFARVLPGVGDTIPIGTTAVSGPIPLGGGKICDIAPLIVCGDPLDTVADDGTLFGLKYGDHAPLQCLKASSSTNENGNGNGNDNDNGGGNSGPPEDCQEPVDELGPGNFQLIQLDCGPGGDCVRDNLAGGFEACLSDTESVLTKPGNTVGPTAQGFNTRFGQYQGPVSSADYPPDYVTSHPLLYTEYLARYEAEQFDRADGAPFRRIMSVPIGDCSTSAGGQGEISILAFGCYFMTEPTVGNGQENWIKGQLVEQCEASGSPGESPTTVGGEFSTYKIILYNDPGNLAS